MFGQLGGGGGFTRTLQTRHQNHSRRLRRQIDVGHAIAHGGGQLPVHDGHQGLAWLQRTQNLLTQGFVFHAGNEISHDWQRHVGFQERHAHLAQHVGHVGFRDPRLSTDLLNELREFVGESGSHKENFS